MLVSLNWLKNYVDFNNLSVEALAEKITKSGIEVDGIHYFAKESKGIVVGYVKSCEQHPNADKLKLCQVDIGTEQLQIICGAPNIKQGQKVVVAKPGAVLPGDFKIKKVKLRGIESNGMICSLQELGIDEQYIPTDISDGIFVFMEDVKIGMDATSLLNLDDVILEFDLTPNRADSLSMLGVAYEVAAILDTEVKQPDESIKVIEDTSVNDITVKVANEEIAPYYGMRMIKDIEVKQSPLWMRNYLTAAGIRPINNVVDITNYVLLEYGQPLHAFDYDRLDSKEIIVREAKDKEKMVTLDGEERELCKEDVVITNGKEPIALAGVMGGANTEVQGDTSTILLEYAYFNSKRVRQTAHHMSLRSEASTRFEKGIDPNRVERAGLRACHLLEKYANAKVLHNESVSDDLDKSEETVEMNTTLINRRLGTSLESNEVADILRKLEFSYEKDDENFTVSIPTRRGDITIFEDMLEEIARIYGYDNLPYTLPASASRPGALTSKQKLKRNSKQLLESAGLMEAISYSLTSKENVKLFNSSELNNKSREPIQLPMPISEDHQYLRLSLIPELLHSLAYNRARSENNLAYYELGSVFLAEKGVLQRQPEEKTRLAGAISGVWKENKWQGEEKQTDFYVAKGIVESFLQYLKVQVRFKQVKMKDMHPGRTALITVGDHVLGFVGQVHPTVASGFDLKDTFVFELDFDKIVNEVNHTTIYQQIPKYPSIRRDIAFVIDESIYAADIKEAIEKQGSPLVKKVEIFDLYDGDQLEEDKKSVAYRLHFQDPDKTLKDKEVEEVYTSIVTHVNQLFGAYVRK